MPWRRWCWNPLNKDKWLWGTEFIWLLVISYYDSMEADDDCPDSEKCVWLGSVLDEFMHNRQVSDKVGIRFLMTPFTGGSGCRLWELNDDNMMLVIAMVYGSVSALPLDEHALFGDSSTAAGSLASSESCNLNGVTKQGSCLKHSSCELLLSQCLCLHGSLQPDTRQDMSWSFHVLQVTKSFLTGLYCQLACLSMYSLTGNPCCHAMKLKRARITVSCVMVLYELELFIRIYVSRMNVLPIICIRTQNESAKVVWVRWSWMYLVSGMNANPVWIIIHHVGCILVWIHSNCLYSYSTFPLILKEN